MTASRRDWVLLPFLTLGLVYAGCSGSGDDLPREPVSGSVTLDGKSLARGVIQFTPREVNGKSVGGGSPIEDGRFSIPRESGLVPGTYTVAVNSSAGEEGPPAKGRVVKKKGLARELIPLKYNAQSRLTAEIKKGGSGDLSFDLQSK